MFTGKETYTLDEDGNPYEENVVCADDCSICTVRHCPMDE